jgi:hypothetical protein
MLSGVDAAPALALALATPHAGTLPALADAAERHFRGRDKDMLRLSMADALRALTALFDTLRHVAMPGGTAWAEQATQLAASFLGTTLVRSNSLRCHSAATLRCRVWS